MSVTKVMTIEEMANHKKWLETRRTGIGGSDAAVVVGLNKYRSLFSLDGQDWAERTRGRAHSGSRGKDDVGQAL